mmetsp:Transcript_17915/g.29963  ORF Transcript_17915/g.29963 Transcript_17915/m.29963 type:complete len:214 (-) Transcript_17915:688-1329(-)
MTVRQLSTSTGVEDVNSMATDCPNLWRNCVTSLRKKSFRPPVADNQLSSPSSTSRLSSCEKLTKCWRIVSTVPSMSPAWAKLNTLALLAAGRAEDMNAAATFSRQVPSEQSPIRVKSTNMICEKLCLSRAYSATLRATSVLPTPLGPTMFTSFSPCCSKPYTSCTGTSLPNENTAEASHCEGGVERTEASKCGRDTGAEREPNRHTSCTCSSP